MFNRTHIPSPPLDQFVESVFFFNGVRYTHRLDRYMPNGHTEIVIDFHDTPKFIFDNCTLKEIQTCHHGWASGLRTVPITIPSGTNSTMMVITFKKGMAAPFFPFPMHEILDSVIDADLVWGSDFGNLRESLLDNEDIDLRFQIIEDFLLTKFSSASNLNPCVSFAIREMMEGSDKLRIARMNQKIGYSQKHFTDIFRRQVGVTPKSYLQLMRFQTAVRMIDDSGEIDWRAISNQCGFYDQSHFINDFKRFSGFTPEQYSQIQRYYNNYIPVD